jgi:hypothetical protein
MLHFRCGFAVGGGGTWGLAPTSLLRMTDDVIHWYWFWDQAAVAPKPCGVTMQGNISSLQP